MKKKKHYLWLASLVVAILFTACNKNNEPPFDAAKQALIDEQLIVNYIADNNITNTIRDTTGVHYKILEAGNGTDTIQLSDRMSVSYQGKLLNGTVFNDTNGSTTTLNEARLRNLIGGWQVGLRKISKGGRVLLLIPSGLGYGNSDDSQIPRNSVLIFDIKLHDFYN